MDHTEQDWRNEREKLAHAEEAVPRMERVIQRLLEAELARAPAEVVALVPEGEPEDQLRWLLAAKKFALGAKLDLEAARAGELAKFDPRGHGMRMALYGKDDPPPKPAKGEAKGFGSIYNSRVRR